MTYLFLALGILFFLVLEGFFSGSETGMISLNRLRLDRQAEDGNERAVRVQAILDDPSRLLSTTLVGTNLSVVTGTALATLLFVRLGFGERASAASTLLMTPLILIFGEIIPKAVFRLRANEIMLRWVGPLRLALRAFSLPVAVLSAVSSWAIERIGGKRSAQRLPVVTREELEALIRSGVSEGILKPEQESLLRGAFQFSRVSVREAMIPLNEVIAVRLDADPGDVVAMARETGYTRFPVFDERIDQIIGLVNVDDILFHEEAVLNGDLRAFLRRAHYVPGMVSIDRALVDMQRRKERMVVVTNEFGGCDGVLTVDDVLEEVVGEFGAGEEPPELKLLSPGVYQVAGQMDIDRFNEDMGILLPKRNYETLAGFLLARLGRVPELGDKLRFENLSFEVLEVRNHTITQCLVRVDKS